MYFTSITIAAFGAALTILGFLTLTEKNKSRASKWVAQCLYKNRPGSEVRATNLVQVIAGIGIAVGVVLIVYASNFLLP